MKYAIIALAGLVLCLLVHSLHLAHRVSRLQADAAGLQAGMEELGREPRGAVAPGPPEAPADADALDRAEKMVVHAQALLQVGRISRADLLAAALFLENTRLRVAEGDREKAEKLWRELVAIREQQFRTGQASVAALVDAYERRPAGTASAAAEP